MKQFKHPFIAPRLEPSVRQLYEFAAAAGEPVLRQFGFPSKPLPDKLAAVAFFRSVHQGFSRAQARLIDLIIERQGSKDAERQQEEAMFRKLADTMAWQMLGNQTYLARRLFRDQSPPTLLQSNFESVVAAANDVQGDDLGKFALISDLTSFVQVGDLLLSEPLDGRTTVVEVKSGGEKNERIVRFVESWIDSKSQDDLELFRQREGEKAAEQAQRIARQMARLRHFAEVASSGESVDPDSGYPVHIPDDEFQIDSYDAELARLIDRAKKQDWAIDVLDGCLFVAAYANKMRKESNVAFERWLRDEDWHTDYPVVNLMNCMLIPLAKPIFIRGLPSEQKFDLLFGRVLVNFGIHLGHFVELANHLGVTVRWSSRQHAATIGGGRGALRVNNRVMVAERGDAELTIFDGLVTRILFEGQRPVSSIRMLSASLDEMLRAHAEDSGGNG